MPLKTPVTASFPPSTSCGTAVCNGPDIDGVGRGAGAGALAGVVVSEGLGAGVCACDGNVANVRIKRVSESTTRMRKVDLLLKIVIRRPVGALADHTKN